jgi:hypothetical protein
MAYTIMVNEEQRLIIERALTEAALDGVEKRDPEEQEELELLVGMFTDLPAQEQENPGTLHGFCL